MTHTKSFPVRGQSSAVTHRTGPPSGRATPMVLLVHWLQLAAEAKRAARSSKDVHRLTGSFVTKPGWKLGKKRLERVLYSFGTARRKALPSFTSTLYSTSRAPWRWRSSGTCLRSESATDS